MPRFDTYLEVGISRFLFWDCSALAVSADKKRAYSLGLFRPARFRDRHPELSLPFRAQIR